MSEIRDWVVKRNAWHPATFEWDFSSRWSRICLSEPATRTRELPCAAERSKLIWSRIKQTSSQFPPLYAGSSKPLHTRIWDSRLSFFTPVSPLRLSYKVHGRSTISYAVAVHFLNSQPVNKPHEARAGTASYQETSHGTSKTVAGQQSCTVRAANPSFF